MCQWDLMIKLMFPLATLFFSYKTFTQESNCGNNALKTKWFCFETVFCSLGDNCQCQICSITSLWLFAKEHRFPQTKHQLNSLNASFVWTLCFAAPTLKTCLLFVRQPFAVWHCEPAIFLSFFALFACDACLLPVLTSFANLKETFLTDSTSSWIWTIWKNTGFWFCVNRWWAAWQKCKHKHANSEFYKNHSCVFLIQRSQTDVRTPKMFSFRFCWWRTETGVQARNWCRTPTKKVSSQWHTTMCYNVQHPCTDQPVAISSELHFWIPWAVFLQVNFSHRQTSRFLSDQQLRFLTHILAVETFESQWACNASNEGLKETHHGLEIKLQVLADLSKKLCLKHGFLSCVWPQTVEQVQMWSESSTCCLCQMLFGLKSLRTNWNIVGHMLQCRAILPCCPLSKLMVLVDWKDFVGCLKSFLLSSFLSRTFAQTEPFESMSSTCQKIQPTISFRRPWPSTPIAPINRPNIHRLILPVLFASPSCSSKLNSSNKLLVLEYSSRPF